jgi:hypothetical protein
MSGLSGGAVLPVVLLLVVLAVDLWVYADATAHRERGRPVAFWAGSFHVDTPAGLFLGCLLLWILFFPFYITSRGRVG